MSKILVKHTCTVINDYNLGDCPRLENLFSIYDPTIHAKYMICLYYDKEQKKLYVPRGFDIWYIEKLFDEKAEIELDKFYPYDTYNDIRVKYLPRDEDQIKALKFVAGKGEYVATRTKSQLQVNLNTGKGKTYIAVGAMQFFGIKSIVITYASSVLDQWEDRIMEYSNITTKEICRITNIPKLLKASNEELYKYKVFLVTHSLLKTYGDNVGWDKIDEFFRHLRVGLKFFDEAHQNFDNLCKIDYFTTVYKTFYLTATPLRSNSDENKIYQNAFKNVLSISLFHKDSDPHTHYIAMRYYSHPPAVVISKCKNKYGLDRYKYTDYIVHNENFRSMCIIVLNFIFNKIIHSPEQKLLIYIGTNKAIRVFEDWLYKTFPFTIGNTGIFTSVVTEEEKNDALTKQIILSTTKSAGAAMDIRGLKCTLLLAEPFKSPLLARQTLGRTRDDNTYYIEIVDKSFYYCNKYFMDKRATFMTYALDTSLIEISDVELNEAHNKLVRISTPKPREQVSIQPFTYDRSVKI